MAGMANVLSTEKRVVIVKASMRVTVVKSLGVFSFSGRTSVNVPCFDPAARRGARVLASRQLLFVLTPKVSHQMPHALKARIDRPGRSGPI
jgi:hypothetical protein